MDAEKFIALQRQMRENNEEVADFMKDINNWKKDMDIKNAKLDTNSQEVAELPAIRNMLVQKKKRKKNKTDKTNSTAVTPPARIPGSDYRAWDKYDVEAALRETEEKPQNAEDEGIETESETDEENENARRMMLAAEQRSLGNIRFKENRFEEAIEHYTTAARLAPEDTVHYTNRAMALLKLERYASAEADCTAALFLQANCIKALYRRALSRRALNNVSDAIEDLKTLLSIEPNNKAAQAELTALTEKSTMQVPENTASTTTQPQVPTQKLRRIPIVDVGGGIRRSPLPQVKPRLVPQEPRKSNACGDGDNNGTLKGGTQIATPLESTQANSLEINKGPSVAALNWFQLERELRDLCKGVTSGVTKMAASYLVSLDPENFDKAISQNLDSNFLARMLASLEVEFTEGSLSPQGLVSRLSALSRLPRFDVAWLMIDDAERVICKRLIKQLETTEISPDVLTQITVSFN